MESIEILTNQEDVLFMMGGNPYLAYVNLAEEEIAGYNRDDIKSKEILKNAQPNEIKMDIECTKSNPEDNKKPKPEANLKEKPEETVIHPKANTEIKSLPEKDISLEEKENIGQRDNSRKMLPKSHKIRKMPVTIIKYLKTKKSGLARAVMENRFEINQKIYCFRIMLTDIKNMDDCTKASLIKGRKIIKSNGLNSNFSGSQPINSQQ